jgi:hypothetical protein
MNDRPACSIAFLFASETIPASATTVTSRSSRTGWSIRRFVRTTRRYRTIHIRAGQQILTAEDPLPTDLRTALALIV